jgi:hypothetical protein
MHKEKPIKAIYIGLFYTLQLVTANRLFHQERETLCRYSTQTALSAGQATNTKKKENGVDLSTSKKMASSCDEKIIVFWW